MKLFEFFPKTADSPISGKIIKKRTNSLYIIKDPKGRRFSAESGGEYSVGQNVLIKNGVIVSLVKVPQDIQRYNV